MSACSWATGASLFCQCEPAWFGQCYLAPVGCWVRHGPRDGASKSQRDPGEVARVLRMMAYFLFNCYGHLSLAGRQPWTW